MYGESFTPNQEKINLASYEIKVTKQIFFLIFSRRAVKRRLASAR